MAQYLELVLSEVGCQELLGFPCGYRTPRTWIISPSFLGHKQGGELEVEPPELEPGPMRNAGSVGGSLAYYDAHTIKFQWKEWHIGNAFQADKWKQEVVMYFIRLCRSVLQEVYWWVLLYLWWRRTWVTTLSFAESRRMVGAWVQETWRKSQTGPMV